MLDSRIKKVIFDHMKLIFSNANYSPNNVGLKEGSLNDLG